MKTIRAFGYARFSHKDRESMSIARQQKAIRDLAADRGWELVGEFSDLESAYNGKHRPDFEAMVERFAEVEVVIVWRLDRVTRGTMMEAGRIAEEWGGAGVRIVTTDRGDVDWTTSDGEFNYGLTALLARQESKRISERTRAGLDHVRELGHYTSRPPFGWRMENKRLVQDPAQQKVLRQAARRYVKGESLQSIAKALGFSAAGPLSKMLHSERVQEALPDAERQRLVVALNERRWVRTAASKQSLLGGIVRCGTCERTMNASSTRAGRSGRWFSYACWVPGEKGHAHIAAPWLDDYVSERIVAAVDVEQLAESIKRRQQMSEAQVRKVSEIEARIDLLDGMLTEGKITAARYDRMNAALVEQLAEAQKVERANGVEPIPVEVARGLVEKWPTLDVAGRRKVIKAAIESVTVQRAEGNGRIDPARVAIRWRAA